MSDSLFNEIQEIRQESCPLTPEILVTIIEDIIRENKEYFIDEEKLHLPDTHDNSKLLENFSKNTKWKEYCIWNERYNMNMYSKQYEIIRAFRRLWKERHPSIALLIDDEFTNNWSVLIPFFLKK